MAVSRNVPDRDSWSTPAKSPQQGFAKLPVIEWGWGARASAPRPIVAPRQEPDGVRLVRAIQSFFQPQKPQQLHQPQQTEEQRKQQTDLILGSSVAQTADGLAGAAMTLHPMAAKAVAEAEGAAVEKAAKEAQEIRSQNRARTPRERRQLTWDEYDALDPAARAAVDFNGMLAQAVDKDKQLTKLDADASGEVTMREAAGKLKNLNGYRAAYKRMYGREAADDTVYAPSTLGLLNSMDLRDSGDIRDFVRGAGFVNDDDLLRGAQRGAVEGPSTSGAFLAAQDRDQLVANVASGMGRLQQALAGGRVKVAGGNVKVGLGAADVDDAGRAGVVDAMREALLQDDAPNKLGLAGEGSRYDPAGGIRFDSLVGADVKERFNYMDQELARQLSNGATIAELMDPPTLKAAGFGKSGLDIDEWVEYVRTRSEESSPTGSTVEKDLMDEIAAMAGR